MKDDSLKYLLDELRKEEQKIENARKIGGLSPREHALIMDVIRMFKNRIAVAKLIQKEAKQALQNQSGEDAK